MEDIETIRRPLNEPTYLRVKRAIIGDLISNNFRPGDHLTIEMLTSRYNVSHMPIREALRQLEGEGILISLAHRGFRVEALSERYIRNMYDIRIGLESMLAHRASENATAEDIAALFEIHDRYSVAARADDLVLVAINIEFHDRIHEMADNPEAVNLLNVRTRIVRTVAQSLDAYVGQDRRPVIEEHAAILEAMQARRVEDCGRAVFEHLTKARDRLLDRMLKAGLIERS
jgi:DNA-binding GntR family transcriptional regulator